MALGDAWPERQPSMKKPNRYLRARLMRAAARELWKRQNRPEFGRVYGRMIQEDRQLVPGLTPTFFQGRAVRLTGKLDLLKDPARTIRELNQIDAACRGVRRHTLIRLELDDVTEIDAAGLLFLCSRVKRWSRHPWIRFWGTYPEAERPRVMLGDAKFGEFMAGRFTGRPPKANVVDLAMGSARGKVGVYTAVMECLENVRTHAYESDGGHHNWYVVGYYDDAAGTSSIAILDEGVGIRATVAPKMKLANLLRHPADFLERATLGFSETGDPKHGKGLGEIRDFAMASPDRSLHVLSSAGRLTISGQQTQKYRAPHFEGTIICVQIRSNPTPASPTP
jgi:hypothetical protein